MTPAMKLMIDRLAADGRVSEAEAMQTRRAVSPDGAVSREEAEFLFSLNERVGNDDRAWNDCFVEAVCDHLLLSPTFEGHISDADAAWLEDRMGRDGALEPDTEVALLLKLLDKAASAPARLHAFARHCVSNAVAANEGVIGETQAGMIRDLLFASAGAGSIAVTREEAEWLFAIDAETQGKAHASAWRDLFVAGVMNHLFAAGPSALLDRSAMMDRAAWLRQRGDGGLGAFISGVFGHGVKGYADHVDQAGPIAAQSSHLARREADAQVAAARQPGESAWLNACVEASGRRTANGQALLEAVEQARKSA